MPSKLCPKCKRIISSNHTPNFCCYRCGSLANEPLLPKFVTFEEQQTYIKKIELGQTETMPEKTQLKLF